MAKKIQKNETAAKLVVESECCEEDTSVAGTVQYDRVSRAWLAGIKRQWRPSPRCRRRFALLDHPGPLTVAEALRLVARMIQRQAAWTTDMPAGVTAIIDTAGNVEFIAQTQAARLLCRRITSDEPSEARAGTSAKTGTRQARPSGASLLPRHS